MADEVSSLGRSRVMVIASPRRRSSRDGSRPACRSPSGTMRSSCTCPLEVAERARAAAAAHDVDALVCVGGGSATGLAKAVALTTGLPIVAVPTTYAGSEATDVWGLTEGGRKTTGVRPAGAPARGRLRRRATLLAAGGADRGVRAQRPRALRRLAVGAAGRPDQRGPGSRGHPRPERGPAAGGRRPGGPARPRAVLYGAYLSARRLRLGRLGPAPQDLPRARRSPTTCRTRRRTPSCCRTSLALNAPGAPGAERRLADAFGSADRPRRARRALRRASERPRALRDLRVRGGAIPDAVEAILPSCPPSNPVDR